MKKAFTFLCVSILFISCNPTAQDQKNANTIQSIVSTKSKLIIDKNGIEFIDLNKNGRLDIY
ncbi:MAG: hypothetical protein AAGK97_06675 [Bacteroidota bacterium]